MNSYDHFVNVLPQVLKPNDHYYVKQPNGQAIHYIGSKTGLPILVTTIGDIKGLPGDKGEVGDKGPIGDKGPNGNPGTNGSDGSGTIPEDLTIDGGYF